MHTFLRLFFLSVVAVSMWSVGAPTASAAVMKRATIEELTRASDLVVRGRVAGKEVRSSPDGSRIFTLVKVEVADTLKGGATKIVEVQVPGGELGDIGQMVHGAPRFADGEEVVVFLQTIGPQREDLPLARVASLAQGKFEVIRLPSGAVARPDLSEVEFFGEEKAAPGPEAVKAIPLENLETRVKAVAR